MTICFVTDYYPTMPRFGGIGVYSQRIARTLAGRGHQVHVLVARADKDEEFEDEGVRVHLARVKWLPIAGRWLPGLGESLGVARHLARLNRRWKFDLVEIPNWEGLGFAAVRVPGSRKAPVVIRLHTSLAESIEMAARMPNQGERFMMWMERESARHARAVVTHSRSHQERMAALYGIDEIELIPHGVPIPAEFCMPTGKMILSIGRMNARKGMETLLEAIPRVAARVPGAEFRIVGPEETHPAVREFRQKNPGLRQVEFLGMIDQQRLGELYEQCAVYVSPATYESFGLTFAEAMARGRPVIGCAASAIPEIVRDGVDGILVPPREAAPLAEAMAALLSDDVELLRMAANARQRAVENYSLETAGARTESYFARVLENGLQIR